MLKPAIRVLWDLRCNHVCQLEVGCIVDVSNTVVHGDVYYHVIVADSTEAELLAREGPLGVPLPLLLD